ncbi:hypothetical protein ACFV9C_42465 [Kribbella sp. NPDC059898]|uniref:hypothetical protein n=1 Tax=Kribbella sp. NPDC059898 TaxID=3346995 RepID=UPI003646F688
MSPAAATGGLVTKQLLERLQRHYIKPGEALPGGVFVPECGWNDGGRTRSRADALYIGFTSNSGRMLIGHELKVSRADWRHELDQAGKADPWHDECHAWYVVAPSTAVVPVEELPDGWGLLIPNPRSKTRMDTVVKARTHPDRRPSWNAMRSVFARIDTLRAATLQADREEVRQKVTEELQQAWAKRRELSELPADIQIRLRVLEQIEAALGTEVTSYAEGIRPEVAARVLKLAKAEHEIAHNTRRHAYDLKSAETAAAELLESIGNYQAALTEIRIAEAS